ncbi:MAG: aminoacyl-tRNA hydrolase [Planctomycetota bacterium]|nr:aminoacyl-tRNA hydrolase [Planctomycetota bacterium]
MTRILFGLGNPGRRYAKTRHNAGWQVLDVLAKRHGSGFRRTKLLHGETADFNLGDHRVRMIQPASFMNLVGPVYRRALQVYEADVPEALVLVDDFSLPMGRLRFRAEGSAGGHNGLKSIQQALGGTKAYPRLKLGIGPAPEGARWADYVLKRYDATQRRELPEMLETAADACEHWIRAGLDDAANRYNAG